MGGPRTLGIIIRLATLGTAAAAAPAGLRVGSVSEPLTAADGSTYLLFLPPTWKPDQVSQFPVLLFLHGVGGINNGKGCRNPGLTTQFPLLEPAYATKVEHIVIVPVAKQANWRHHFASSMALVDMAIAELGGDTRRVSIAGQSMGGHGAYLYASKLAPGRFCAVVAMCGYVDDRPIHDKDWKATKVIEPLKSTPIWVFHAEEDDAIPPPGRPQDDGQLVVDALRRAGNSKVKYTRYESGKRPPNYIPGHAAFEFAFAEAELWPWLSAQALDAPRTIYVEVVAAGVGIFWCGCTFLRHPRLAWVVSTLALLLSAVAFLGLMQSEGGVLDFCRSFSFFDVDVEQCRAIGARVVQGGGAAERGWLALVISKGRAENCFALGMGVGALYGLLFVAKGTAAVAPIHLMHAAWAMSVCAVNAQNAGLLPIAAEANIDAESSAKLVPFVVITGVQAVLDGAAFLMSRGLEAPMKNKQA